MHVITYYVCDPVLVKLNEIKLIHFRYSRYIQDQIIQKTTNQIKITFTNNNKFK